MNLKLAADSIRKSFADWNADSIPVMISLLLIIALILAGFAIHQHRYYYLGRWIFLRRLLKGEPVSTDRVKQNLELILQLPYQLKPFRTRISNLSPHGMFVRMDPPLLPGESFRFLLNIDKKRSIQAFAEVRWCLEKATAFTQPGMGCKFFQMSEDDQNFLRKFVKSSKRRSGI